MKKMYLSMVLLLFISTLANAQVTYADDVAAILFEKCTQCHRPGGIAPFSLMTFADASPMAAQIQSAVTNKIMPPWPPDDTYQNYSHKRSLSAAQIAKINDWVNAGAPQGNAANTPPAPVYTSNSYMTNPDLSLRIPNYVSKATASQDDYVCFSLPTGISSSKKIRAVEVVPGNHSIVHHCLVYIDANGTYATDTSGTCGGPQSTAMIAGYAPGGFPSVFPNGPGVKMGATLNVGAKIVLALHYPNGSQGQMDSTRVNIYFYEDTVANVRQVSSTSILQNWSFCVNANQTATISNTFPPSGVLPTSYTLLSVFPHAHLLGQNFLVYGLTGTGDTIPIIRIPKWDFDWQGFYLFKNPVKLPAGGKLYGKGLYDNTTNNVFNPNNPPQNICAGLNTTDEMFLVYFQYLPYQTGDEFLDLEALTQMPAQGNPTSIEEVATGENYLLAYPNPFNQQIQFEYWAPKDNEVSMQIFDIRGQLVRQLYQGQQNKGTHQLSWDGKNDGGADLNSGLYLVQLRVGSNITTKKVMLAR